MLIAEIYNPHPQTIKPDVKIKDALKELIGDDINGLVVVDDDKRVVGVLSLQDIAAATVPREFRHNLGVAAAMYKKGFFTQLCHELENQPVSRVMRRNFQSVTLEDNIMAVTADFLKNDLYIVPVVSSDDNHKLIGVVTRTEIKDALAYGMGLNEHWSRHTHEQGKGELNRAHQQPTA